MTEQTKRELISPKMLNRIRNDAQDEWYKDKANALVGWIPGVLTYDMVFEKMQTGVLLFGLRFVQSGEYDLNRLREQSFAGVQAHLATMLDMTHYDWELIRYGDDIHLRLTESHWWQPVLISLDLPDEVKETGRGLLKELDENCLISQDNTELSMLGNSLVVKCSGFQARMVPNGLGIPAIYLYNNDDTLLSNSVFRDPVNAVKRLIMHVNHS